ncbi:MAG: DUF4838 domain-containing protein [Kiritimatiellae bacterium]|nr:DUF4838 domain-containing protein [Kiritimatiellia bacterium]
MQACRTLTVSCLAFALSRAGLQAFTLSAGQACTIVVPEKPNAVDQFAAAELARHLKLVFGADARTVKTAENTAGAGLFCVGIRPESDPKPFEPEESRYLITPAAVYLYGEDRLGGGLRTPFPGDDAWMAKQVLSLKFNRTGTLFAVYDFLEYELGVHWVGPGDEGIVYRPLPRIQLPPKSHAWVPRLKKRHIRPSGWSWRSLNAERGHVAQKYAPEEFRFTEQSAAAAEKDVLVWLRRMRMGCSENVPFGHSFMHMWTRYGKDHPDWFAVEKKGGGRPSNPSRPDRLKLCVSNPEVAETIVADWAKGLKANPPKGTPYLRACPNDGGGFCLCEKCLALDVRRPGEPELAHLTDRYVIFWNRLVTLARQHDPNAMVCSYAYSRYFEPPRRERLKPGIILGFVAGKGTSYEECAQLWSGWKEAGVTAMVLRPNQLYAARIPVLSDIDKKVFDVFQLGLKNRMIATDYDTQLGNWANYGLTYYTTAKAHVDPSKPFEHWENEYLTAYGAAAPEVREYFHYWRRVFDANVKLGENAKFGNALWETLHKWYTDADFARARDVLQRARARRLAPSEQARVEQLLLANEHNRLWVNAIARGHEAFAENGGKGPAPLAASRGATRALFDYRLANRDRLGMHWPWVFATEIRQYKDAARIQYWLKKGGLARADGRPSEEERRTDLGDE